VVTSPVAAEASAPPTPTALTDSLTGSYPTGVINVSWWIESTGDRLLLGRVRTGKIRCPLKS
jgi:hypothetical protein